VGSIDNRAGRVSEEISLIKPGDAPSRARKLVKKGTVLYSTVRPYLRNIAIVEKDFDPKAIASTAFAVLHPSDHILSDYLFFCVRSSYFTQFVESKQKGVAYPAINAADLKLALIPIPPIGEQREIIAKVDELMALCDQLEERKNQRDKLRTAARESAINAISTAQTPEELDTAWKRVNDNWDAIADTPESVESLRVLILELALSGRFSQGDNSWNKRTLGQVTKIQTGKLDANASSPDGEYPFFTCAKSPLRISTFSYDTECVLLAGNGNFDVNYYSGKFDAYQRTYIIEAKSQDELFVPYLFRFMQGHSKKLLEQSVGGVIKYIKIGFLTDAPLLLPPYSEQKRIVSKVEKLMALCDQLEAELKERSEVTEKFARSIFELV
jgi:type I restriction enzyme S subunit